MTTKNIAIVSAAGVAAVALIGTGTALMIRHRNRSAAQAEVEVAETPEMVEESVAAGAEAFLAEQEAAVVAS